MDQTVTETIYTSFITQLLLPLFFFVLILGGALLLLQYVIKPKRPYKRKQTLLTETELKFYKILQLALNDQYQISLQVRLADIINVDEHSWSRYFWDHFRPLAMKSIDFVICDKDTLKVLLLIELDDYTHNRQKRVLRDSFVDDACKTVGIPIYHQKVQSWYKVEELRTIIQSVIINT